MDNLHIKSASIDSKSWIFQLEVKGGSNDTSENIELIEEDGSLLQTLGKQDGTADTKYVGPLIHTLLSWMIDRNSILALNLASHTSGLHSFLKSEDIKGPHFDLAMVKSMYGTISPNPTMPARCVELYADFLYDKNTVIEYGSGGSTLLSQKNNVKNIISTESDFNWILAVIHKFNTADRSSPSILHPVYVNIGPTGPWGSPATTSAVGDYSRYPIEPWLKARELKLQPELVLIDGRFRVACFITALLCATPGTVLIFDDYNDRPQYHIIETLIKPIVRVDRQAIFIVPESLDTAAAHQLAMLYSTNPA